MPLAAGRIEALDVFAEGMLYGSTERAMESGDFRLMWDEGDDAYRLFRPSADAGETIDVSARFRDELRSLRELLERSRLNIAESYA